MKKIQDIIRRISSLEARVAKLEGSDQTSRSPKQYNKKIAIKEFLISKKPKNDVQKTLLIAYYLEDYEKLHSFNVVDLESYYRSAKEPVPQNLNDKVNMNIRKGHIMETKEKKDGRKAFALTNTGEAFVKSNFGDKKNEA